MTDSGILSHSRVRLYEASLSRLLNRSIPSSVEFATCGCGAGCGCGCQSGGPCQCGGNCG